MVADWRPVSALTATVEPQRCLSRTWADLPCRRWREPRWKSASGSRRILYSTVSRQFGNGCTMHIAGWWGLENGPKHASSVSLMQYLFVTGSRLSPAGNSAGMVRKLVINGSVEHWIVTDRCDFLHPASTSGFADCQMLALGEVSGVEHFTIPGGSQHGVPSSTKAGWDDCIRPVACTAEHIRLDIHWHCEVNSSHPVTPGTSCISFRDQPSSLCHGCANGCKQIRDGAGLYPSFRHGPRRILYKAWHQTRRGLFHNVPRTEDFLQGLDSRLVSKPAVDSDSTRRCHIVSASHCTRKLGLVPHSLFPIPHFSPFSGSHTLSINLPFVSGCLPQKLRLPLRCWFYCLDLTTTAHGLCRWEMAKCTQHWTEQWRMWPAVSRTMGHRVPFQRTISKQCGNVRSKLPLSVLCRE